MNYQERLERLRRQMRQRGVHYFLVAKFSDIHTGQSAGIRWLCGFSGSNGVLAVSRQRALLITDGRYQTQAQEETQGAVEVVVYTPSRTLADSFADALKESGIFPRQGKVGFEAARLPYDFYRALKKRYPLFTFVPLYGVVEGLQVIKGEAEVEAIRRATDISDRAFSQILPLIRPGVKESEVAAELSYRQRRLGAERDAFESIVASGPRSALPHGIASDKVIEEGEFVTLDFGCFASGYVSDLTRTVVVGKASSEQVKVYNVVKEAQMRAIEAVREGKLAREVDQVARQIIAEAGYSQYFTHGLGHGIGMEVHAAPRLNATSPDRLRAGMVVTIEPGIYIPGWGGVRIEDDILVTENGAEVLTQAPKDLIQLSD